MKKITSMLGIVCAVAVLALASGCSSTKNKESMLSASGFKTVPANTPQQEAHLKSLPADKLTMANQNGHPYWVFPDPKNNVLYVGQEPQYQEYQKMRQQNELAAEQANTAEMNANWGMWGAWGRW